MLAISLNVSTLLYQNHLEKILEKGLTGKQATQNMAAILKAEPKFEWLTPPTPNGSITVLNVIEAKSFEEHEILVKKWARNVWQAWEKHHEYIAELVEQDLR